MMNPRVVITVFAVLISLTPAFAYEVGVHRLISRRTFDRLQIDFRNRFGVGRDHRINGTLLVEFVEDGAENEDFLPLARPLHHFLDPEHNVPLTTRIPFGICLPNGIRADDRAELLRQPLPLVYREALLGPNPGTRDAFLKEFFEGLGHVIHLVQDMAQPEHTRNDQHLTYSDLFLANGTAASVWEQWGLVNLLEAWDPVTQQPIPPVVSFDGYPTVDLPHYRSYFQTPEYPTLERKGLANFSNRNFVTQDTNYSDQSGGTPCDVVPTRCYEYAYPFIDDPRTTHRIEPVHEVVLDDGGNYVVRLVDEWIYTSQVYDAYTNTSEADPFHTFHSLLDMETRTHGCPVYSLGDGSYLSRASMLIPRAVGYSAGLIEHFFRGKIDVTWASTGNGKYDMTITNRSEEAIGADARVDAVFRADPSYFGGGSSNDTGLIVGTAIADAVPGFVGLASGQSVTLKDVQPFGLRPEDLVTKFERRVVVSGTLGSTANEVIGVVQPPITTTGFRAEITWPENSYPNNLWITDGSAYEVWFRTNYERCQNIIPNLCIENPPVAYTPVTFKIDPFTPGKTYQFLLGNFCIRRQRFTMTTRFYLDDELVKTETSVVREGCNADVVGTTFATFP